MQDDPSFSLIQIWHSHNGRKIVYRMKVVMEVVISHNNTLFEFMTIVNLRESFIINL
jgi:hypothetical protein